MGKGKKFLSLFLAAALAVTGISVGAPVTAEAATEAKAAQEATVNLALEQFEGSGDQMQYNVNDKGKVVISAMNQEPNEGDAHNAAFVRGEESAEGTTFAPNGEENPSFFGSGGRVAAVRFKIADGLTEAEIGEAVLRITFSEVGNLGNGKMRLGVYETEVEEFAVVAEKDSTATEGDKAFPAINNDYSYAATMWSNFVAQKGYNPDGSSNQVAEVDVTRAVKNAVKKGQNSIVLRLQVPTGGGRMHGVMAANASEIPANAPTLTVTRTTPVTIQYAVVSGDDTRQIREPKQVLATIGKDYTYEVPEDEKVITADDGTGIATYEYLSSDPETITVTADDGVSAKNVITLKYKEKLADKTALTEKINEVKDYVEENYTPETWAVFAQALNKANQVAANKYATDTEIAEALVELTAAAGGLSLSDTGKQQPATDKDKAELADYIAAFEARITGIAEYEVAYSQAARTAFAVAVADVKAKTIETLKNIEDAKNELKAAETALKAVFVTPYDGKTADIKALDEQIQTAQGLLTDANKAKNASAYNTLKAAKETAERARNTALTTEVTKEQVTGATTTLKNAITAFRNAIAQTVVEETSVTLDKTAVTLAAGKNVTLRATVKPANAGAVVWSSSDSKVATVVNGKVTAKKAGTAKITAKVGNKTATCTVTVISLSKTKLTLGVKEKLTLKVNGTKKKVTWTTSNKKVATVKNGKITAKKANKKAITITAKVDGVSLTCKVTVKAAPKKLILKGKKTITVKKKKTVKLKVSLPKNTAGTLKYKTSNRKVATVDAKGKVKGIKKGTAKITVTAANNKKAKVTVTVKVK